MRKNMYRIICMFALSMFSANADVITGVTATATTEDVPYRTASHLVDGSGLTGNQHETYSAERMWLSGATSPQSVVFDLGAVYNVSHIKVWNYNEAGDWPNPGDALVNLGANAVSVTFGTTLNGFTLGGATGTVDSITSFAKASGLGDYTGETFSEPFKARYIKFDIASSHGHPLNRVGLSEIQFAGTAAPGPPITGFTATATTESGDRTAANLVDGFGLSGGMHSTGPWQMWLSGAAIPQSVVFDLGALYDVNQLKVWNYNEAGDWPDPGDALVNLGANAVSVTYGTTLIGSTLGGATGTVASIASFAKASGASNYSGETFNAPFQARYVKFDIATSHGHPLDRVGLSEVQFLGTAAPGPATGGSVYVYDKTLPSSVRIYTDAEKNSQLADGRQMLEEMHMAIADGEPSYTISPGVYRFEGPRPIVFYKVENFTLFARNVEFIYDDLESGDTTLWIEECQGLTIQGPLIIDADPIPYSQATVLSSDIATGLVTLEIMAGYDVPPNGGRSVYYAFTPNGRFIPQAYNELSNFTLTNSGSRIITAQGGAENFSTCLKPGNLVVIGEGQGTPVMFHSSVSLIDVDIHTGAGAGWGPSNGSMSFKGVRGIPRPGTNRLKGSFAPQMSSVSGDVLFENCVFQNCNDDALNYQGGSLSFMAYRQDTPHTLIMYGGDFVVGSEIEVYDSVTFEIKSKGIVQNIEVLNDAAMETDARIILNSVTKLRDMDLGDMRRVAFDNEMAVSPGDIASNRSERAENLIIRNCYFYGSGHSIVAQSFRNALFENNVVETVNSGLMFVAGMWWWESAGLENITIRNNKFIDTATSFSRGSFAINIGNPDPAPPAVNYTATHLVRNVLIEGNTIRSSKEGGVEVKNAENIVIRNNTFYNVEKAIVNLERVNYATIKSNYADNLIEVPFILNDIENVEIDANILSNAKIDETNLATVTNGKNVSMGVNPYSMGWIEPPDMPVFPLPIDDLGIRTPNGGESWIRGTNHMIYWIPGGTGNVKIDLMRNGSFFASIAANTPNTGSYDWAIAANQPTGFAYRIRITSLEQPADTDASEVDFAIAPVPAYHASMDTDPGWSLGSGWAYGRPAGSGGDPSSGAIGQSVIGYNLNGSYGSSMSATRWATTPAIDCSRFKNVSLGFQRWLGVGAANGDRAYVQVSNNATNWTTVWQNPGQNTDDKSWVDVNYDISAVADGQATVFVRWGLGPTNLLDNFCGWNIDEVTVTGDYAEFVLAETGGSTQVTEGGATDTYSIALTAQPAANVTVTPTPDFQVAVSPVSLTFTPANWAAPQAITVTALNDSTIEATPHSGTIVHTSTSADVGYHAIYLPTVVAQITDSDNHTPVVHAGADRTIYLINPWSPLSIGPLAWYDASDAASIVYTGGAVSRLSDKSGNGHHMLQDSATSQPMTGASQINGRNTIAFDGANDGLKTAVNPYGATINDAMFLGVVNIGTITDSTLFSLSGSGDAGNRWQSHAPWGTGNVHFDIGVWWGANTISAASGWSAQQPRLLGFYGSATANRQEIWDHGTLLASDGTGHSVNTVSGAALGYDGSGSYDNVQFAEVVLLHGTVSEDTRQSLEGYLAHKWGLAGGLPTAHPYKTQAPQTAIVGLQGTATDADHHPLPTEWSVVSGPATVLLENAQNLAANASFEAPGVYTLRLTVSDGYIQVSDDVVITVQPGPAPLDHFLVEGMPSQAVVGNPIHGITITARGADGYTATTFTGAVTFTGTAGITGTSANFTEGVLSGLSLTPLNAGSGLTLMAHDGVGHSGAATLDVLSRYQEWAGGSFTHPLALAAATADPDGDGLTNFLEFALGLDPTVPGREPMQYDAGGNVTTAGVPIIQNFAAPAQAPAFRAVFARRKDHQLAGLNYSAQFSADLQWWTSSATPPTRLTGESSSGPMEAVSVPFPDSVPVQNGGTPQPPHFFRLSVAPD